MRLADFLLPANVSLDLRAATRDEVFIEMVGLLAVDERSQERLVRLIVQREQTSSTGIGRGIAIPHCRSMATTRIRIAFGRHLTGVDFGAPDQRPVHGVFLIIAPPNELANHYLPVLAKIAQLAKEPDIPERINRLESVEGFFGLLEQKGI
jgi:mannitol/fructose-specific phosphotransferase system IIA component (Ntr-type)